MSGHNKWSKIKRKKGTEDAKRSKIFSKLSLLITSESKKVNGDVNSPSLATVIESAKKENMPKDTIDRAVKKGTDAGVAALESITYEAYGPGGCAIIIESLTDNKNRAAAEVRHTLSKAGFELATPGAATWSFERSDMEWVPTSTINLNDADGEKLGDLIDNLEDIDDVQTVYTNAD